MATRLMVSTAGMVLLVMSSGVAEAQRGGAYRRSTPLFVATVKEAAKELKLTGEQRELAKKLLADVDRKREETFQGFGDLSDNERRERYESYTELRRDKENELAESIGKEKFKRLRQLTLQSGGLLYAFFDREAREKLNVTDDQRRQAFEKLGDLREEFREAGRDPEAIEKLREKVDERVESVLSSDQLNQWKKLLGEPAGEELLRKILESSVADR